jgi:hypothetical protein
MKPQSRRLLAGYLGAVFVVGLVIGATTGYTVGKRSLPQQLPPAQKFEDEWLAKYRSELELTEEQVQAIQPLLRKPVEDLGAIWYRAIMTMGAVRESVDRKIEPLLKDHQREKLLAWIQENREKRLHIAHQKFEGQAGQPNHIWFAAAIGDQAGIRRYLEAGVDINKRDLAFGMTPLAVAAVHGQAEAVEMLLSEGADVNARHPDDSTALHAAAFFGRLECVRRLLRGGANAQARNEDGETALEGMEADWETIQFIGAILQLQLDRETIERDRKAVSELLHRAQDGRSE